MDREKTIEDLEHLLNVAKGNYQDFVDLTVDGAEEVLVLLKEQETVVHPKPSCEMAYITDCRCDLCGVQLIREDNFCRCCGKRIEWEGR